MDPVAEVLAALKDNDHARAEALLRARPGVANAPTSAGLPLLQMAIYARASRVVQALLDAGAEVDVGLAAMLGDERRVRDLAARDPAAVRRPTADGFPPLAAAAHFGRLDAMRALLELGADPAARSANVLRNTPLHAACAGGREDAVRLLLERGAPVDAQDAGGHTPLMIAAANGLAGAVRLLLEKGADPARRSADGRTAQDHARARGWDEVAAMLG
ncbi:MAG TPA: ankyrin repeat domain-containing protein [Candidatus Thermoplasmatota archaeon]|nr:ankyrin repeat domain-containing protein [Candidatus Thermoplasmatota archaeon]